MEAPALDRDALLALLDRMLRAEAVSDAPPTAERGEWLYGSAGFTEPDKHGWMAPAPPADVWVPRALVFWRMAILSDAPVSDEQTRDPRHSLARWPAIERAVFHRLFLCLLHERQDRFANRHDAVKRAE